MKLRVLLFAIPCLALFSAVCATAPFGDPGSVGKRTGRAAQQPGKYREYPGWEYNDNDLPMPPDANVPGEWVFARFNKGDCAKPLIGFAQECQSGSGRYRKNSGGRPMRF